MVGVFVDVGAIFVLVGLPGWDVGVRVEKAPCGVAVGSRIGVNVAVGGPDVGVLVAVGEGIGVSEGSEVRVGSTVSAGNSSVGVASGIGVSVRDASVGV